MTTKAEMEIVASATDILVPLAKLKKSPRNARRTPHSEAGIEALAGSIHAKGMLQNLVVEPERGADGEPTGFYLVTVGEGRRLAQLLRVKRKQIKKSEPIRCVLDETNDPQEISLDENVTREAMHPADQFEAFRDLSDRKGWGAEEIAARFGVTPRVVRQRLRLGAVSPRLMEIYREGGLTLDQLTAFAVVDDPIRQEQVFDNLSWNREPAQIRRDLLRNHVPATDRRAVFVGVDAYEAAGGTVLRDLFTEEGAGFLEDVALLDRLVLDRLALIADAMKAEGWKWAEAAMAYPHSHGMRRIWPEELPLSVEDEAALAALRERHGQLAEEWSGADELPDEIQDRFDRLEAEIEAIEAKAEGFAPEDMARAGVFVMLGHDGAARIERGFVRAEDEQEEEPQDTENGAGEYEGEQYGESVAEEGGTPEVTQEEPEEEAGDAGKPISDSLLRDLTAHRTLGLRIALGEQPDIALLALTHTLAAQIFYHDSEASPLDLRAMIPPLGNHASGIEDTAVARVLADRHARWCARLPRESAGLWQSLTGMEMGERLELLAHCAALTVSAVRLPWDRRPRAHATTERIATALMLDMANHWTATVDSYFGRVTKAHILAAVAEAVDDEAAERLAGMKKQPMAEAAQDLLAGTFWLPAALRTAELDLFNAEEAAPMAASIAAE